MLNTKLRVILCQYLAYSSAYLNACLTCGCIFVEEGHNGRGRYHFSSQPY